MTGSDCNAGKHANRCMHHGTKNLSKITLEGNNTQWSVKRCQFILDHNSHVSWWIFTLLLPMRTGMNALGSYKIYNLPPTVSLHYL